MEMLRLFFLYGAMAIYTKWLPVVSLLAEKLSRVQMH